MTDLVVISEYPPTAESYGALGNGGDSEAEDTAALESAFADGSTPILLLPGKDYRVLPNRLVIPAAASGKKVFSPVSVGAGGADATISCVNVSGVENPVMVSVRSPHGLLENVKLLGAGRTSGLKRCLEIKREGIEHHCDLDFAVRGCVIMGAEVGVYASGRGLILDHANWFADTQVHIDLDWPEEMLPPYSYGSSLEGGARKYQIKGQYFHSASIASIRNTGGRSTYIHGIDVVGCHQDDKQRFLYGDFRGITVQGNNIYRCDSDVFDLWSAGDAAIVGNRIAGDNSLSSSGFDLSRARSLLKISGSASNVAFNSNVASYTDRSPIHFTDTSSVTGFQCLGLSLRDVCLDNANGRSDSIVLLEGNIRDSEFSGITANTPSMTGNASSYLIKRIGSGVFDHVYGGNNRKPDDFQWFDGLPMGQLPTLIGNNYVWPGSSSMRRSAAYPTSQDAGVSF